MSVTDEEKTQFKQLITSLGDALYVTVHEAMVKGRNQEGRVRYRRRWDTFADRLIEYMEDE